MKKRILLFILLLTSGVATFGQRFNYGVHVGMNVSGYQGGDAYRIYDESAKVGAEIGGDISYRLTSHLLLLSGLNLSQYGGKFSVMSPYVGVTSAQITEFKEVNTQTLSFELPIKVGYEFNMGHNFSIIPSIGMFGRYAVASLKGDVVSANGLSQKWHSTTDYDQDYHHIDAFKRWDYGAECGIDFRFARHYSVSASYKHGLKSLQPQYNLKSNAFSLSVGYVW